MASVPHVTLNDGNQMPMIGLGTSRTFSSESIQAVKDAIDIGYRHFDCAFIYRNEKNIGVGLTAKIAEGVVKREDLYITSKVWNTYHRPGIVETALRNSLKDLGLDYVDLYLIHWPTGYKEEEASNEPPGPKVPNFSDYDYVDTWKAMEEIQKKGLAKSIGVSNFNKNQLERILEKAEILPVVNQIECHPYLNQNKLIKYCKSKNIQIVGYSPFASPGRFSSLPNYIKVFENPKIIEIANKYNKTPGQVILRWQIQRDVVVIPKSINKNRIKENFTIFDFHLSTEDISIIDGLNTNSRFVLLDGAKTHQFYPFYDEY
ncbi:hypothetical protein RN001_006140 [Aquatica leii]|uniref:NADP-dependent oxidoreductase domain-containing protein n=1 Tax=Aquatica leii TaxID=1421715 RepID=A0AAN7PI28_9COLE|nr:hypothetical protein RN001_006140 [Aquatica leii]